MKASAVKRKGWRGGERRKRGATENPVGVAVGAAGGAAAGAAMGSVAGPVGTAVGAAVGGLAGGLAGKAAVAVDPVVEDAYWQENYRSAPYVNPAHEYAYYQPAYRFGWESYSRYGRRSFDEVDEQLMRDWDAHRGLSLQTWREAREAARDAWLRVAERKRSGSRKRSQRKAQAPSGRRLPQKGKRVLRDGR